MECRIKSSMQLLLLLVLHMLVGSVLPMEDYMMMESSDFPMPESTSIDVVTVTMVTVTMVVPTLSSSTIPTSLSSTVPIPSSVMPPPTLETSTMSPPISPTPEPSPVPPSADEPFFNYFNKTLYLFIQKIQFDFKHYSVLASELNSMKMTTVMPTDLSLIRTYSRNEEKMFELTFFFDKSTPVTDGGEGEWQLDSFQHQNFSEPDTPLYQYSGPVFSIKSLLGRGFNCSNIEFIGTAQGEPNLNSRTKFTDLSLQPFLTDGRVSSDFDSCDSTPVQADGLPVEVIVGVTVAVGVTVVAITITMLAVSIKKYQRRRNYDLLNH